MSHDQRRVVLLADEAELPADFPAISYESWIAGRGSDCKWGDFPEDTAAGLCYTSGTTGDPKGVLYCTARTTCTASSP